MSFGKGGGIIARAVDGFVLTPVKCLIGLGIVLSLALGLTNGLGATRTVAALGVTVTGGVVGMAADVPDWFGNGQRIGGQESASEKKLLGSRGIGADREKKETP